jgi:hypothetical protein
VSTRQRKILAGKWKLASSERNTLSVVQGFTKLKWPTITLFNDKIYLTMAKAANCSKKIMLTLTVITAEPDVSHLGKYLCSSSIRSLI